MSRIFISYKRDDKDIVFPLKDRIEAATGEKCWIDLDGIESDAQFANVIIRAIDEADVFLFMYSKQHAKITDYEKDYTIREISYAQDEKKRIVFVNLDHTPLTKWFKFMFSSKQQVDATSEDAFNHLLQDINKWLGKSLPENNPMAENSVTVHRNDKQKFFTKFKKIENSRLPNWIKFILKVGAHFIDVIITLIVTVIITFIIVFIIELCKPKTDNAKMFLHHSIYAQNSAHINDFN